MARWTNGVKFRFTESVNAKAPPTRTVAYLSPTLSDALNVIVIESPGWTIPDGTTVTGESMGGTVSATAIRVSPVAVAPPAAALPRILRYPVPASNGAR